MGKPVKARRTSAKKPTFETKIARISVVSETSGKPRTRSCPRCHSVVELHVVDCLLSPGQVFEKSACTTAKCDYGTCSDLRPRRRGERTTAIGNYIDLGGGHVAS